MIVVSTSGFSYDDWIGRFYPTSLTKQEQLPYFSGVFDAVELNYSFYSYPGEKGIDGHIRRAPGMRFSLKGHSNFTHKRAYSSKDLDIYRSALKQLSDNKALISLLLQFPYSFHFNSENLNYVKKLAEEFEQFPVAIEFRHARWKNTAVYQAMDEQKVSLVTTDAPELDNLYRGGWEEVGPFSYIRLHGRNSQKWWEHEEGWQRYDYLYSREQISGMAAGVKKLANPEKQSEDEKNERDVYVFFNNHWQSQGVINALQLAIELGMKDPDQLPKEIIERLEQSRKKNLFRT